MVFELLGQSVFDFLKANEFRPFPIHHIQQFAKQILTSVACKHIYLPCTCTSTDPCSFHIYTVVHELKLIHTDLKPENILLVDSESVIAGPNVSV